MVDKFIGDAMFAVFNAPVDLEGHAQRAVQCALDMDDFAENFRREQNAKSVDFGLTSICVHTAPPSSAISARKRISTIPLRVTR
jgi:adenylate cyclase